MIILRNKQFSPTTRDAKEELLKYIEGKKLFDFSKISIDEGEELRKMISSLDHSPKDFMKGRAKPYVPENVEGIFDKLGMEKTSKGIREMIYKSTNPEILKRVNQMNGGKNGFFSFLQKPKFKEYDDKEKLDIAKELNKEAYNKALTFMKHNTPHKQDGGDIESWFNKHIAIRDKKGRLVTGLVPFSKLGKKFRKTHDDEHLASALPIFGTGLGIMVGKEARKNPATIAHEAGHLQNGYAKTCPGVFERQLTGPSIAEEIVASTRADKNLREMGKSKEEIRQGNISNGLALDTYLPSLISSKHMGNYLIDQTHLADKIKKN